MLINYDVSDLTGRRLVNNVRQIERINADVIIRGAGAPPSCDQAEDDDPLQS